MKKKTGTREWAEVNKNCFKGCSHNCLYCYAKADALRFHKIKRPEDWETMTLNENKFHEKIRMIDGRIMFPTQHDILPDHVEVCINYLLSWLFKGNQVLIVTKPHLESVTKMIKAFKDHKHQITFRFTIGSMDDEVLKFWEPHAPDYDDRFQSLRRAYCTGYNTSVSHEPYLDPTIFDLVKAVEPYVTDSIWIGKMNHLTQRVSINTDKFRLINKSEFIRFKNIVERVQTDKAVRGIYNTFINHPKVKWKESIKNVLGLPEEKAVG